MAWTTPRTWSDDELVTPTLMNTHVRDNLNYLKANPVISETTQPNVARADAPGQSYGSASTVAMTASSVAIPADVGAVYVELWSHNGVGYSQPPGSGFNFLWQVTVRDSVSGVDIINSSQTIFCTTTTDSDLQFPYYARSTDYAWAGTTRTFTVTVTAINCYAYLDGPSVLRVVRSY